MNKGLRGFPSRDSLFSVGTGAVAGESSGDPYAPPEGVAYMAPSDDIVRGDLVAANPSRNCFPLRPGSLPSEGTSGDPVSPPVDVLAATSVISVAGSGLTGGGAVVAYAREAVGFSSPAVISAADLPLHDACLLASGDYVVGYGIAPTFQRFNSSGVSQSSSDGSSTAVPADIAVAGLADGGFVGVWGSTGTPVVRFRRYNASGTLQGSEVTVESVSTSRCSVAGLTGGGFVIAYVTAGALKFAIYDAGGTIVGSAVSVVSGISTNAKSTVSVVALSGGGFAIAYASTAAAGSYWFGRYDASGTLLGALTQAATTSTVGWVDAAATNSGGFAIAFSNQTNLVSLMIFSATGVQVGTTTTITTNNSPHGAMTNLPSGDLVIAWASGNFARASKVNVAGTITHSTVEVEDIGAASQDVSIAPLSDERFVVVYNANTTNLRRAIATHAGSATFARFNATDVRMGLITDLQAEPSRSVAVAGLDDGGIAFAWTTKAGIPQVAVATSAGVLSAASAPESVYARSVAVSALAGGGFVVAYEDYFGGRVRFRRYTPAGVANGAAATVESTVSASVSVARLDTGGFVVAYLNASGHARFATFTSAGAAALAATTAYAQSLNFVSVAGASAGRFALFFSEPSVAVYVALVSAAGAVTLRNLQTANVSSGAIAAIPGDMYALTYLIAATSVRTARLTVDNELMTTILDVEAGVLSGPTGQAVTSGGDTWSIYTDGSNVSTRRYVSPIVVLGAAMSSASPGGLLPVKVSGTATLRFDWGPPQSFDHTAADPLMGNSGTVVGRAAILKGF